MEDRPERRMEPHDRKTRIANEVIEAFTQHPEHREGDRCIVMLFDDVGGGIGLNGYEDTGDDVSAMVDMFLHLRAIARANGKDLEFISVPNSPEGLDG